MSIEEETDEAVLDLATSENVVLLCCIAPFPPTRITPTQTITASFRFPDEYAVEEFVSLIDNRYPEKENRPPLYLLIHSPGGTVSSSYVVSLVLRKCFNQIVAFIPHVAASGASIMVLSCNEVVMGDISRLTGIDPSLGDTYALNVIRAFDNLVDVFSTRTAEETPYPFRHLLESITAEKYDEATHILELVRDYTTELMEAANYSNDDIKKIIKGLLYDVQSHEEVFMLDRIKELGVKAKRYSEDERFARAWVVMNRWLKKYYLQPSPIHIIKYALPTPETESLEGNNNNDSGTYD